MQKLQLITYSVDVLSVHSAIQCRLCRRSNLIIRKRIIKTIKRFQYSFIGQSTCMSLVVFVEYYSLFLCVVRSWWTHTWRKVKKACKTWAYVYIVKEAERIGIYGEDKISFIGKHSTFCVPSSLSALWLYIHWSWKAIQSGAFHMGKCGKAFHWWRWIRVVSNRLTISLKFDSIDIMLKGF